MQDLNWVQHWVSRIGLSVVLDRSPPKHSNQENWSSTHFYWFKSPPWSRKSLTGEAWMPVQAPNIAIASNHGTIVEMSVFKGFILWSLSELIVLFRRCRRVKQWEENIALFSQVREPLKKGSSLFIVCHSRQATLLPSENSLQTADAFPVVASLPPKNSYFSEGEKRRLEMRLRLAGYSENGCVAN